MNKLVKKLILKKAKRSAEYKKVKREAEIIKYGEEGKPRMTSSKKYIIFLFANFTIIEIYSLIVMVYMQDISALSGLIASVIGSVVSYAVYSAKATKENLNKFPSPDFTELDDDTVG